MAFAKRFCNSLRAMECFPDEIRRKLAKRASGS
jgi:hypothetical protein